MKTSAAYLEMVAGRSARLVVLALFLLSSLVESSAAAESDAMGENPAERNSVSSLEHGFRFTKHLFRSHTVDVVKAPISTVADLVNVTLSSSVAWVKRADIRFRRTPLLNRKEVPSLASGDSMDMEKWERWLDRHVATPETGGSIDYLIGGEAFYGRLIHAVSNANESVLMQTYIFDNDDVALDVADAMKNTPADVDVRMLYDGMGTLVAQRVNPTSMPESHHSPYSMHSYLEQGNENVDVRRIHNRWLTGDHTKSTIIDHEKAFVGGMNIGREYRHDWHDMMVELNGPVVGVLESMFEKSWDRNGRGDLDLLMSPFRRKNKEAGKGMRLLRTAPGRPEIANAQVEAIKRARNFIYVQNAYFSDDEIVHELCKARKRGVDVRVIVPSHGNHGIMESSNKISMNRLIKNGVRVYYYPGMSHIKAAVFDGWACFGTANYDKMSLIVNRELNIATSDEDSVNRLINELFLPDMAASIEMNEKMEVSFVEHIVELLADEA